MEFKDILKELRIKNNLTQLDLAKAIFVSRSAIAKWENGLGLPNEDSVEELMKYFNVTREYLFPVVKQEDLIIKNEKIHKVRFNSLILYSILILIIIILPFFISGFNNNYAFTQKSGEDFDKTLLLDGYYIEIDEEYLVIESGVIDFKYADNVYAHKRKGHIYYKERAEVNMISFHHEDENNNEIGFGILYMIKDDGDTYHYFYDHFSSCAINWTPLTQEELTIEINGEKQELIDGYYFTSKYNLFEEKYEVKISGIVMNKLQINTNK